MALDLFTGFIGAGFTTFFLGALFIGVIDFLGKIYGSYRCLVRQDTSGEQRIIYFLMIWFIPLGWVIYFLLGHERTSELFSEIDFL